MNAAQTFNHDSDKAKRSMRQSVAQALQAANPHLIPGESHVIAAKNIRIELKRAFPGVKFSVKSESFSMGNAVRTRWTDGPTTAQVEEITNKYSAGSFDSMQDIYEYSHSTWKDAFGDSKYISTSREYSDAFILSAIAALTDKYGTIDGEPCPTLEQYKKGGLWCSQWERPFRLALCDTPA